MSSRLKEQTFFDHLDELRLRILKALAFWAVASCLVYRYIDPIIEFFITPVGQVVFTSPEEAFVTRFMVTLLGGFLLAFPLILYQIWAFLRVGLTEKEKKFVIIYFPFSLLLFVLGVLFAYTIFIPLTLKFLLSFSSDVMVPMITAKNYLSFVGTLIFACGVVFEMPLVLIVLTRMGIATPAFLVQKRRHAIVILLIISAVITPPDLISQILLAIPLIVLYEIGVVCSKWVYREPQTIAAPQKIS